MKKKQLGAILVAGALVVGSIGCFGLSKVKAAPENDIKYEGAVKTESENESNPVNDRETTTNTFVLSVPANEKVYGEGWNSIGAITIKDASITSEKEICVKYKKSSDALIREESGQDCTMDDMIVYRFGVESENPENTERYETVYPNDGIYFEGNGSKNIGVGLESFSDKKPGTYKSVITFTAELVNKESENIIPAEVVNQECPT